MAQYRVVNLTAELPYGAHFTTVPEHPMRTGELALFSIGERLGERLIVGRWYPDVCGFNWIIQKDKLIRLAKDVIVWIIGKILPIDTDMFERLIESGLFASLSTTALLQFLDLLVIS